MKRKKRFKGFTLIEILMVIGLIVILLAMLIGGWRDISYRGKLNITQIRLMNLEGEMANALSTDPHHYQSDLNPPGQSPAPPWPMDSADNLLPDYFWDRQSTVGTTTGSIAPGYANATPFIEAWMETVPANFTPMVAPNALLDGWGYPLIFCPSGGLTLADGSVVKSPDGMPFWASGGPTNSWTRYAIITSFQGY